MMLSHYHGQSFNASELGRSLQISDTTARRYLDILTGTFMVSALQPWFENISKRQVKTPKIFFRDSGIFHSLIGVSDMDSLMVHPKLGASWEGYALEQVRRTYNAREEECFFWAVHQQAELDLLIMQNGRRLGFEIKFTDSPRITQSMKTAIQTLHLDSLVIVIPGSSQFTLAEDVTVSGLERLAELTPNFSTHE
jgi:predicted AAA+ superfamily ATPase